MVRKVIQATNGVKTKRILIVDDTKLCRLLIKDALILAGYSDIHEAVDGQEGLKKYLELQPDLVVMDIRMPNMDGLAAIAAICAIDSRAKIIICSSIGSERNILDGLKKGAKDFIQKPFVIERFHLAVNRLLPI